MAATEPGVGKAKKRALVQRVVFVAVAIIVQVLVYHALTPERSPPFDARATSLFHVAGVRIAPGKPAEYVALTLALANERRPEHRDLVYLLPERKVQIPVSDLHEVSVLESRGDEQLVEYRYGNTVDSVSRYRAYRDRIEPVSVRVLFDPGIMMTQLAALLLTWVVGKLVGWALRRRA